MALVNDKMVRIFRLRDGSFAIERGCSSSNHGHPAPLSITKLDEDATFWDDDHFGTSILDEDGFAEFTGTILTAMYYATEGDGILWNGEDNAYSGITFLPFRTETSFADVMQKRNDSKAKLDGKTKAKAKARVDKSSTGNLSGGSNDDTGPPPSGSGGGSKGCKEDRERERKEDRDEDSKNVDYSAWNAYYGGGPVDGHDFVPYELELELDNMQELLQEGT